jgi:E3 ubiquitin-protein ligase UBR1
VVVYLGRARAAFDASECIGSCSHILLSTCDRDCALDDSCVLCSRCFHATNHSDHNVSFFIAQQSGGCCDCGDEEAWRVPIGCPHHPPVSDLDGMADLSFEATPKASAKSISGDSVPTVKNYPYRVSVPPELLDTMNRTVGYALDFLLDTLDYSPDEPFVPANEADLRLQPSADPMMKDQYCVLIWNDDKHSIDETVHLVCDCTNRSREEAFDMINRLDEFGREIIDMNTNVTKLLEIAQTISQIDLGVTIRRAYDTFREQVAAVIIEWLLDLTRSRLGTDTVVLREVVATELLSPRRRDNIPYNTNSLSGNVVADIQNPTRIDWLFLYHTRLWKRPRLSLKEIYASVLTLSRQHKLAVGERFCHYVEYSVPTVFQPVTLRTYIIE